MKVHDELGSNFDHFKLEALQRAFLMKADSWSYEEEVRIVKSIDEGYRASNNDLFDDRELTAIDKNKQTYVMPLPYGSIKEIILGCRVDERSISCMDLYNKILDYKYPVQVSKCYISRESWSLKSKEIDYLKLLDNSGDAQMSFL